MNRLVAKDVVNQTMAYSDGVTISEAALYCLNAALSIVLVVVGGLFAGLTLA
jgi:hypothetical protein